jgi:plastocyanin
MMRMDRRIVLALPGFLLVIALRVGTARADDAQATIDNFSFSPPVLTVSVGTTVTWTNRDDIPHTVADADHPKAIKSSPLDTGDSYSRAFPLAGTYHYFCSLHPHMQGTVVVK